MCGYFACHNVAVRLYSESSENEGLFDMSSPGERRTIFAYASPGEYLIINRENDDSISLTVNSGWSSAVSITVPAVQWRKMVAAFALEPDLFPGCDCTIKTAQAEVGKPHGEPLA